MVCNPFLYTILVVMFFFQSLGTRKKDTYMLSEPQLLEKVMFDIKWLSLEKRLLRNVHEIT